MENQETRNDTLNKVTQTQRIVMQKRECTGNELTVYFHPGAVLQTAQQKPGSRTWMAAITSGLLR